MSGETLIIDNLELKMHNVHIRDIDNLMIFQSVFLSTNYYISNDYLYELSQNSPIKIYIDGELASTYPIDNITLNKTCTCGADKIGSNNHSSWCDKRTT